MPATSPRLSITVSEDTKRAFQRLATAQRRPLGAVMRDILDASTPAVSDLATTMEALRGAQDRAKVEVVRNLAIMHDELLPHFQGILGHLQAITDMADEPDPGAIGAPVSDRGADRPGTPATPV